MNTYTTTISASSSFCASLHLPLAITNSLCNQEHGYTFKVTVAVTFLETDTSFFFDYNLLEQNLIVLCKKLDYSNLNKNPNLEKIPPSSENIAKWFIHSLEKTLSPKSYTSISINIKTKPGSSVTVQKNVN